MVRRKPRALPIKPQGVLTTDKAWLLGLIAGDGSIQVAEADWTYKLLVNCGVDVGLADLAAGLIREVYGVECSVLLMDRKPPRVPYYNVHCARKAVVEDLLSLSAFGINRWRVPEVVLGGSDEIKAAWICGFADADGSMIFNKAKGQRQATMCSVNAIGIGQISSMLDQLQIRHLRVVDDHAHRANPAAQPSHVLIVCYHADLKRYASLVGFRAKAKAAKLKAAVESYQRLPRRREEVTAHLEEVRRLREAGETWSAIALSLGLSRENVRNLCSKNGIKPTAPVRGKIDRMIPEIRRLRAEGRTAAEIAAALGLRNATSVRNAECRAARAVTPDAPGAVP